MSADPEKSVGQSIDPEVSVNPYQSPVTSAPVIQTSGTDSPLVAKLRRKSGNDLIWCAVAATVFGFFIPFGVVLDAVSLFLIGSTIFTRARPNALGIVFGVVIGLWNTLRLGATTLMIAVAVLGG